MSVRNMRYTVVGRLDHRVSANKLLYKRNIRLLELAHREAAKAGFRIGDMTTTALIKAPLNINRHTLDDISAR